jgi:hypothetical protein
VGAGRAIGLSFRFGAGVFRGACLFGRSFARSCHTAASVSVISICGGVAIAKGSGLQTRWRSIRVAELPHARQIFRLFSICGIVSFRRARAEKKFLQAEAKQA